MSPPIAPDSCPHTSPILLTATLSDTLNRSTSPPRNRPRKLLRVSALTCANAVTGSAARVATSIRRPAVSDGLIASVNRVGSPFEVCGEFLDRLNTRKIRKHRLVLGHRETCDCFNGLTGMVGGGQATLRGKVGQDQGGG